MPRVSDRIESLDLGSYLFSTSETGNEAVPGDAAIRRRHPAAGRR